VKGYFPHTQPLTKLTKGADETMCIMFVTEYVIILVKIKLDAFKNFIIDLTSN
jgi:hypothetical protein